MEKETVCGHNCGCQSGDECHAEPALKLFEIHDSEKSFKEDYDHENGQYINHCIFCTDYFMGHKRRVCCKVCQDNIPKCEQCNDTGYYHIGGSFGGSVQTQRCDCQFQTNNL